MQTPSARPESLQQPSQLARGALLSPGDLQHPKGNWSKEGCPIAMCWWWCVEGSRQLELHKQREAVDLEKGLLRGQAATAGSAFLCARGRHEHILTAGFRRGKGHEKFES